MFSSTVKAQIVDNAKSSSFRVKYLKHFNESSKTELPKNVTSDLDHFFKSNSIDVRYKSKIELELKMCFNEIIKLEDRLTMVEYLIIKYRNETSFPLFILEKQKAALSVKK
jgi:hypothetical protein